jgi:hypothetical protein
MEGWLSFEGTGKSETRMYEGKDGGLLTFDKVKLRMLGIDTLWVLGDVGGEDGFLTGRGPVGSEGGGGVGEGSFGGGRGDSRKEERPRRRGERGHGRCRR